MIHVFVQMKRESSFSQRKIVTKLATERCKLCIVYKEFGLNKVIKWKAVKQYSGQFMTPTIHF